MSKPPFSQRLAFGGKWIHDDFPRTARIAVLHLLHDLVERRYIDGWISVDKEVRRISRDEPRTYSNDKLGDIQAARSNATETFCGMKWVAAFDFCERLHSHLAVDVTLWDDVGESHVVSMEREKVQLYIADEVDRIFLEERLGFSFVEGEIRARGRRHTRNQLSKVEPSFADQRLSEARQHFAKALRFFDNKDKNNPDYENVIKEAVCAVEAAAKRLFPDSKGKTLGEVGVAPFPRTVLSL